MSTGIAAGIRTAKTPSNPYGWKSVELSAIDFSKPTVFCISGDGTLKEKDANAMAKYANKLLGRIGVEGASDLQIVSVFFSPESFPAGSCWKTAAGGVSGIGSTVQRADEERTSSYAATTFPSRSVFSGRRVLPFVLRTGSSFRRLPARSSA